MKTKIQITIHLASRDLLLYTKKEYVDIDNEQRLKMIDDVVNKISSITGVNITLYTVDGAITIVPSTVFESNPYSIHSLVKQDAADPAFPSAGRSW